MSFGQQFLAGQRFAQGLVDTYQSAKQRRALEEIADAKPQQVDEFTAEQGEKIQQAAADPTTHIGYDNGIKAYMATPKLTDGETGPAQPVEIARQAPMTEFLGKKTPGTMTPDQVASARQLAMADVISKSDPIQGMRLQREVKQGERDDKRWEREERTAKEEEDFKTGQQAEFAQTIYGKRMGEYATQVQAYEQYQAKLKSGAAPETLGAPPPMPQRPVYSVGESLADTGRLLAFKASKGKADPAEILQYAERLQKVSDEGYGKALKLAQGGAPLAKVIEQFNQTGSMKLDPAAVVSDEMVKDADGVPSRVIKVRDANGNVQTINALSELDAIGQAESYFNRFDKNRTFNLNERRTAVSERQADIAERRLGALEARANGGGGGRGGSQDGGGAASFDPLGNFDSKKAQAVAFEQAAAAVDDKGRPLSPAEQGKRAQQIYRSMEDAFATENRNRHVAATVGAELRAARSDPSAYAKSYSEALQVMDAKTLEGMGFKAPAGAKQGAAPAPSARQGAEGSPATPKVLATMGGGVSKKAEPYTPPADSPAGKAQASREAARTAKMEQEAQRIKAVTDAASAAIASSDPAAAQAVQSMPGFGALPLEQKAQIRSIVFGR